MKKLKMIIETKLILILTLFTWTTSDVINALEIEINTFQAPPGAIEASLNLDASERDTVSAVRVATSSDHHCVWFDKCGQDPDFQDNVHNLNCVYEGKPGEILKVDYTNCFEVKLCLDLI
jgi:hypothetical protein